MIISASRRTDIPAFYSEWFMNRIREQYVYVRNPVNIRQVGRILLNPKVIDCIVFWSKNPAPMIPRLGELQDYMYYFQYTLNAYEKDMERNLPSLAERIGTFQFLSRSIGKQRVIWRYDPIILNEKYTIDWHTEQFSRLAEHISGFTEKCIISFVDIYSKNSNNLKKSGIYEIEYENMMILADKLSETARLYGFTIETCAEQTDLSSFCIGHGACIDGKLISNLLGCSLEVKKDKNQRHECGCASSIDIGFYNTCQNGCIYCYANHSSHILKKSLQAYDSNAPLLCS